jgi:hypothetical protein
LEEWQLLHAHGDDAEVEFVPTFIGHIVVLVVVEMDVVHSAKRSNAQGKRRRSTEGAEGTNTGHENAEGRPVLASA